MTAFTARLGLAAYRIIGAMVTPVVPFYLAVRALRGKEEWRRLRERLGRVLTSIKRPSGPLVWMHAASVGETMALAPIIEHILAQQIHIVLTTGTCASAQLVKTHFDTRLIHQYAPLDLSGPLRRFLNFWRPDLAIVCESEIWPRRIEMLSARRIPQLVLNAHLSTRSFKNWKKYPALAQAIFSKFDCVLCQEQQDFDHYHDLGTRKCAICGNMKADVILPGNRQEIERYLQALGNRSRWAAISTHEGEELMAAKVHRLLRKRYPDLVTLIVPRHIERADAIAHELNRSGLRVVRKSLRELPQPDTDILLGDTIGEMGFYLKLTEIAFVGKSMMDKSTPQGGGHNPLEPALTGVAILSGPNIENFKTTYQQLLQNQAAHLVNDITMLAGYVHHLLERPAIRQKMIEQGRLTAHAMSGATLRSIETIEPFLKPLILAAQLMKAGESHDF